MHKHICTLAVIFGLPFQLNPCLAERLSPVTEMALGATKLGECALTSYAATVAERYLALTELVFFKLAAYIEIEVKHRYNLSYTQILVF